MDDPHSILIIGKVCERATLKFTAVTVTDAELNRTPVSSLFSPSQGHPAQSTDRREVRKTSDNIMPARMLLSVSPARQRNRRRHGWTRGLHACGRHVAYGCVSGTKAVVVWDSSILQ